MYKGAYAQIRREVLGSKSPNNKVSVNVLLAIILQK